MHVFINNVLKDARVNDSVSSILAELNIDFSKGVAIAVNDEIIRRNNWDTFIVKENDRITVIRASQGG